MRQYLNSHGDSLMVAYPLNQQCFLMITPSFQYSYCSRRAVLKLTLLYFLGGVGWLLLSDWLLLQIFSDLYQLAAWQFAKGVLFVGATSLLVYLLVARDYARLSRLQNELAENEARYRQLAENAPLPTLVADGERCLYANPAALRALGADATEQVIGQSLQALIHPADWESCLVCLRQVKEQGKTVFAGEVRLHRLNHEYLDVEATGAPLHYLNQDAIQIAFYDISAHKRAEAELRLAATVFETTVEGVVITDANARIITVNRAFSEITGYQREEVQGLNPNLLKSGRQDADFYQKMWAQIREQGMWRGELWNRRKDGCEYVERVTINAVHNARQQLTHYVAVFSDISEFKRAEAALLEERALLACRVEERTSDLRTANIELMHAARAKDEFLAAMSHELRTPLNAVLGMSEMLREEYFGPLTPKQTSYLKTIAESGQHLLDLINDILDVAKAGSGKLRLEWDNVVVEDLCNGCLRLIKQSAQEKQLKIAYHRDPEAVTVPGDYRRLKQILVNLLSNAVKFTPPNGQISLTVQADVAHAQLHFLVRDTGIGITPEDQACLFQPFVQLDSALSRQYNGTGLGLALVREMTELHGGVVDLSSEPGQGSCFQVSLHWHPQMDSETHPLPSANDSPVPVLPTVLPDLSRGANHILLAEDNPANITAMCDWLELNGYMVTVAVNGLEAVQLAKQQHPDLILMDIQMPGLDGLAATREIRLIPALAQVPIIALTALVMPGDRERCLAAGANEYLSKPVSLSKLRELLFHYLGAPGQALP